ncbi:hypothetical protein [Methyloceanibacter superfactus]|jgi:hypothetical protein|uniref:hypothetical protein n=1 Tax=Methyloceanibacter superfactus TaxID=1774969 RepID=UPI00114CCCEA|nr:hypothetical protein [Methyloceanibacter superfactus]
MSVLSLLSGAVLAGLIYGLSFFPTATLTRYDDDVAGLADDTGALPDPDVADAETERRERDTV